MLAAAREVAGHTGPVVAASQEWLEAHEVTGWSGPRSLTLWLPWADHRGFERATTPARWPTGCGCVRSPRRSPTCWTTSGGSASAATGRRA
nr:hypothetical protein [Angustibacter aerolatus]